MQRLAKQSLAFVRNIRHFLARFKFLTALLMKIQTSWEVMCPLVKWLLTFWRNAVPPSLGSSSPRRVLECLNLKTGTALL